MDKSKKILIKVGVVFISLLIFLTFFSNTIYNFNLPSVSVAFPGPNVLRRIADGRGVVDFAEHDLYYATLPGRLTLYVAEGQTITEGERLFSIRTDIETLERMLDDNALTEERILLRLERAQSDLIRAETNLREARDPAMQGDFDPSEFDFEIARLQRAIESARRELAELSLLYDLGAVARIELYQAEQFIESLYTLIEVQYERRQTAYENFQRNRSERARNTERDLGRLISDIEFTIREQEFELLAIRAAAERLRQQIREDALVHTYAERDGVIREVRADAGAHVHSNARIMSVGAREAGFKAIVYLSEDAEFLFVGAAVTINVSARNLYGLRGVVDNVFFIGNRLRVDVRFDADRLTGGEIAHMRVERISMTHEVVIPNSAVRESAMGYYFLYVERHRGTFRDEFILNSMSILIIDRDSRNSAVTFMSEHLRIPIVISSDRVVNAGDSVRIVGGSDLIAIR